MRLIDGEALYEKFAELEEEARNKYITTTNEIEKSWWSIVLTERTAYKRDMANAPTIAQPAINLKMRLIEYIEARDDAMYTKGGILDLIRNFE